MFRVFVEVDGVVFFFDVFEVGDVFFCDWFDYC